MKLMILPAAALGLALALGACVQKEAAPVDTSADVAAIAASADAWASAYGSGDATGLAALYADDAWLLAPGRPTAKGRAEIEAAIAQDFAAGPLAMTLTPDPAMVHGDIAIETGTWSVAGADGMELDRGKWLAVHRKGVDGWKLYRDTYNSDNPPPAAAAPPATK